jgi:hypothetical protein
VSGSTGRTPISPKDLASSAGAILSERPSQEQARVLIQPACQSDFDKMERFYRRGAILARASGRYSPLHPARGCGN